MDNYNDPAAYGRDQDEPSVDWEYGDDNDVTRDLTDLNDLQVWFEDVVGNERAIRLSLADMGSEEEIAL